jgi:hypothetical protein
MKSACHGSLRRQRFAAVFSGAEQRRRPHHLVESVRDGERITATNPYDPVGPTVIRDRYNLHMR